MSIATLPRLREASDALRAHIGEIDADVGLVLGSGLGTVVECLQNTRRVTYEQVPHLVPVTIEGHLGEFVAGNWRGRHVACLAGRVHRYEGHSYEDVTFGVRLLGFLGVKTIVVTNAAGAVDPGLVPGQVMVIADHVNLTGSNPLIGPNDERIGPRFVDLTDAYDPALRALALEKAASLGIACREGVYAGMVGPSYETPAEIRLLRILGADAVGMSTVPETIVARHQGMRVLGLSCITNLGAGLTVNGLTHDEVAEVAGHASADMAMLLEAIVPEIPIAPGGRAR